MSKQNYDDDDGRVIADMSGIERQSMFAAGAVFEKKKTAPTRQPLPIERELSVWKMTWLALRLVLPIVFAFLGIVALFLLFCQFVWLR